eukprot:7909495-Alexandrium_andersonii.AAC.1
MVPIIAFTHAVRAAAATVSASGVRRARGAPSTCSLVGVLGVQLGSRRARTYRIIAIRSPGCGPSLLSGVCGPRSLAVRRSLRS